MLLDQSGKLKLGDMLPSRALRNFQMSVSPPWKGVLIRNNNSLYGSNKMKPVTEVYLWLSVYKLYNV